MHVPFNLILCSLLQLQSSMSLPTSAKRDADFLSVRTRLHESHVDPDWAHPNKYFHESTFHRHYDGRFADQVLGYDVKQEHLSSLIRSYLSTMHDIGLEAWLMHGTLLGWYWNRKNMPWDSDLDVMVSEDTIDFLASFYNMTMHHFRLPGKEKLSSYLLEINPHCREIEPDEENKIDARWIDTDTGLFIDITTLRRNRSAIALSDGELMMMMVKDQHHYNFDDVYPLRESVFEGTPALVPFAYPDILMEEYGEHALSDVYHDHHYFDVEKDAWVPRKMVVVSTEYDERIS